MRKLLFAKQHLNCFALERTIWQNLTDCYALFALFVRGFISKSGRCLYNTTKNVFQTSDLKKTRFICVGDTRAKVTMKNTCSETVVLP